jgi:hypothetical protein
MSERFPNQDLPRWMRAGQGRNFREYVEWQEALMYDWVLFNIFRTRAGWQLFR